MNPIRKLIANHNHKKSIKAFDRIKNSIEYSTNSPKSCVLYLGTDKGYEELFDLLKEQGWYYEISGNNREGIFLTVLENKFKAKEGE